MRQLTLLTAGLRNWGKEPNVTGEKLWLDQTRTQGLMLTMWPLSSQATWSSYQQLFTLNLPWLQLYLYKS